MSSSIETERLFTPIVHKRLEEELNAGIDAATEEIKRKLRAKVGTIALEMLKHYEITAMGDTITIRVQMKELPRNADG